MKKEIVIKQKSGQVVKKTAKTAGRRNFAEEIKVELRRVSWPDRETVTKASLLVLFIVIFSTVFVSAGDVILVELFQWLKLMG